ncbi:MAG: hypothetical protein QME57_04875, partial [Patescibacteria group bacterium]|nr:hypothetical protein [Patescibacteria group bacterium]
KILFFVQSCPKMWVSFSRKAEVFKKIYEGVIQKLTEADILVISGWSMSGFDEHYKQLFEEVRKKRKSKQLSSLAICDVQESDYSIKNLKDCSTIRIF